MSNAATITSVPIEEIKVGMEVSCNLLITDHAVRTFAEISGDKNPIHIDEEYAKKSRFKKRIAHGLMSASLFSNLFGTQLPGEGCVYAAQSLNFKRPVYIGDDVVATATVEKINLDTKRVFFKTVCKVNNKVVIDGHAELFVP